MPTSPPSKSERLSRLLSRLRSRRSSASSLVVQTGFPTSLADLIVKNRAKFRKRRKPSPPSSNVSRSESVVSVSAVDDRPIAAVATPDRIERKTGPSATGAVFGLGFLMVNVVALVVLAAGGRCFVAGITVLAFGFLVVERFGLNLKAKVNAAEGFDSSGLGLVSPIREVEDHRSRDFEFRTMELVSPIREFESVVHQESPQTERILDALAISEVNMRDLESKASQISDNSRKSWRRLISRKLFKRKKAEKKDEKESIPSLNDNRVSSSDEGLIEREDDGNGDEEFFSFESCDEVIEIDKEDVSSIRDDGKIIGKSRDRWKMMVLFIVVLLGLLRGKVFASVLTVAMFPCISFLNTLEQCGRNGRWSE